jgi:hypothetical protein
MRNFTGVEFTNELRSAFMRFLRSSWSFVGGRRSWPRKYCS